MVQLITRWRQRRRPERALETADIVKPTDAGGVYDGVDYSVPPVVPWFVPRQAEDVQKYLTENVYTDPRSTYRFQFDGNRSAQYDGRVEMPTDDPLEEWDFVTRKTVLTNCHAAYHRNPLAKQAVDLTRRFVVGKGHTVTAQNADVQAVLDEFRTNPENYVFGYDRAFIQDIQVDGELFVRMYAQDGKTVIAQIPPWYVEKINTARGFFRRVQSYIVRYTQDGVTEEEEVPADEMLHVSINNHGYELRGRPDLFVILPWLRAYNEWIVDRARQNKWRNALLWVVKVASRVPGAVAKVRAVWRTPPTPGSVAVVPDSVDIQALSNSVGAGDAAEDGRQIKLQAIVGVGLPEYMMSDGENANLASATAQQLPALWKFTDGQELMVEQVWTPIYKRVIQAAIDKGDLEEMVPVQDSDGDPVTDEAGQPVPPISALEAFTVAYYELQGDDPKTLADAFSALVAQRISSIESAREKIGLNNAIEEKRLAREESAQRDRVGQGRDFDVQQPGEDTDTEDEAVNAPTA